MVVLDPDFELGMKEVGGRDHVAIVRLEAAGVVELDETPAGHEDPSRAGALEDEVVGDDIMRRGDAIEEVVDHEHAIAVGAAAEASVVDLAAVVAGGRQVS